MGRPFAWTPVVAGAAFAWLMAAFSIAADAKNEQTGVIGKPFRVSASVTEYCSMKPTIMMCESFRPALDEFLAEARDARWAPPVERLIFESMLVKGKPWAEIRALECRRTICALEYAVSIDDLDHSVDGSEKLETLMQPITGVIAPELPSNRGKGKMVSILIWRKI